MCYGTAPLCKTGVDSRNTPLSAPQPILPPSTPQPILPLSTPQPVLPLSTPSLLSLCLHLNPSSIFDSESPPLLPCDFWASATFGGFCLGRSILSPPPVTRAVPQAALCLSACICVRAAGVSSAPAAPSLCSQTTQLGVLFHCDSLSSFPTIALLLPF